MLYHLSLWVRAIVYKAGRIFLGWRDGRWWLRYTRLSRVETQSLPASAPIRAPRRWRWLTYTSPNYSSFLFLSFFFSLYIFFIFFLPFLPKRYLSVPFASMSVALLFLSFTDAILSHPHSPSRHVGTRTRPLAVLHRKTYHDSIVR